MSRARRRRASSAPIIAVSCLVIALAAGSLGLYHWLHSGAHAVAATAPARSHAPAASARPAASVQPSAPARPAASVQPSSPATPSRPDPLGSRARSLLATRSGRVLAAVYDLDTRQTWTIGTGPPQAEASVVKVDVLETLLAQRRRDGQPLSAQDQSLATAMIEDSDNDAATALWNAVGGATGIRSYDAAAGLSRTSPSACVVCAGFPWPGWGLTTTTAVDQVTLLRQIVQPGHLLTRSLRRYALHLMEDVTPDQRWGVSGGVSSRATVALKNGWLPLDSSGSDWQINSVGWISGSGRDYLVAVLSTGNPSEQYGIDTIDALSAIVWKALG